MKNALENLNSQIAILDGSLIVGNHDTITVFGGRQQAELSACIKSVTRIAISHDDALDENVEPVLSKLDEFKSSLSEKKRLSIFQSHDRTKIAKEYVQLEERIEQVCSFLQLQQVQLLKEVKILSRLQERTQECIRDLDQCIKNGELFLLDHRRQEDDDWFIRLERRIDELRTSSVVGSQNIEQIKILCSSNMILYDRLSYLLSNTFPLWVSQTAALLHLEKLKKRISIRNEKLSERDISRLQEATDTLKVALEESKHSKEDVVKTNESSTQ